MIQPKKRSGFLPHPPQGKINSLWHFPAFLIFNQTIVKCWPPWAGLEDFPSRANLPTPGPGRSGHLPQPALQEQCPFVACFPSLRPPLHAQGSHSEESTGASLCFQVPAWEGNKVTFLIAGVSGREGKSACALSVRRHLAPPCQPCPEEFLFSGSVPDARSTVVKR